MSNTDYKPKNYFSNHLEHRQTMFDLAHERANYHRQARDLALYQARANPLMAWFHHAKAAAHSIRAAKAQQNIRRHDQAYRSLAYRQKVHEHKKKLQQWKNDIGQRYQQAGYRGGLLRQQYGPPRLSSIFE